MKNADGWVIIGADLDSKKFDSKIQSLENKAKKTSNDIENEIGKKQLYSEQFDLAIKKAGQYEQALAKAQDKIVALEQRMQGLINTPIKNLDVTQAMIRTREAISTEKAEIMRINDLLDQQGIKQEAIGQKIREQDTKIEQKENLLKEINAQLDIEKQKQKEIEGNHFNINKITKEIGNSVSGAANKVVRWGLAVFGVRSAYMGIRRAISLVSAQNEQVANSFQQIERVIAGALLPIVQAVINTIVKLMAYVNIIWKALTGKALFNFADATKKASSNLKSGAGSSGKIAKNLKDAKKQLAGFDEMNVLQDQEDTSGGGGGGAGGGGADFGNIFDKLKGVETPKWLQWILDHGPEVIGLILGIAGALTALKLGATPLQALGVGLIVAGVAIAIGNLIKYLKDPSLENFGKIITGIGIAFLGLSLVVAGIPAIIGAIILAIGLLITYWDKIKAFLQGGIDWLAGKSEWVHKVFGDTIGGIYDDFVRVLQLILNTFDDLIKQIKKIFDGIIKIVKGIIHGDWKMVWQGAKDIVVGLLTALVDAIVLLYKPIIEGVKALAKIIVSLVTALVQSLGEMFVGLWNLIKSGASTLWNGIKNVASTIGTWFNNTVIKPVTNFFTNLWNGLKNGAQNAWNGVKNIFSSVANWFNTNVVNRVVTSFRNLGSKVGSGISGAFKAVVNGVLRTAENVLNSPIRAVNSMLGALNKLPGVSISRLSTFSLPRLAKGGIVNLPGRGVPIAATGESGPEGVIPLTDSQQMALLGEAIGKYININATIPVYVGNRLVLRELRSIQSEDDFAYNR